MPPTVFDTCEPRADVLAGAITESDFAADLAQVIRGTAPAEYKNRENADPMNGRTMGNGIRAPMVTTVTA